MRKYIVAFELEVTADKPSDAVRTAHRRMLEVATRQLGAPVEVWDLSFSKKNGTGHATGQPRVGRVAGWRCITSVKEKE